MRDQVNRTRWSWLLLGERRCGAPLNLVVDTHQYRSCRVPRISSSMSRIKRGVLRSTRRSWPRSLASMLPGMSEFPLPGGAILGLMPEGGIRKTLGQALPDPSLGRGIPRAELYLLVSDPNAFHQRALDCGATELSPLRYRDWGHRLPTRSTPTVTSWHLPPCRERGRNVV